MKSDIVQIVFVFIALVLAAALQDMSPAFGGAKPPFLQVFALYMATRRPPDAKERGVRQADGRHPQSWIWTAIAAGYMMESLSGLPWGCCIGFMLPACALAHAARRFAADMPATTFGMTAAVLFAPLQEAWLDAWGVTGGGSAFVRFFASALPAAATGAALFFVLPGIERFAGLRGRVDT